MGENKSQFFTQGLNFIIIDKLLYHFEVDN